jgi:hypothetical protein
VDFQIGGRNFKISKIDAFKQFHVVRRIGPILADLLPGMKELQGVKNFESLGEGEKLDAFAKLAAPFMNGLAKLSDEDAERVLYGLLTAVEIQGAGGGWMKISNEKILLVQDLELPILMNLAGRALMHNLSGFFGALPR